HGVNAGAERPIDPILEGHDVGGGFDRKLVAGRLEEDAPAATVRDIGGVRRRRPDDFDAGLLQVLPKSLEEPERDDRRRDGWNFENRMADGPLKRRERLVGA